MFSSFLPSPVPQGFASSDHCASALAFLLFKMLRPLRKKRNIIQCSHQIATRWISIGIIKKEKKKGRQAGRQAPRALSPMGRYIGILHHGDPFCFQNLFLLYAWSNSLLHIHRVTEGRKKRGASHPRENPKKKRQGEKPKSNY